MPQHRHKPERLWSTFWVMPAAAAVALPSAASLVFVVVESLNGPEGVAVYRHLVGADGAGGEFWPSVAFTLAVATVASVISAALSVCIVSWWHQRSSGSTWMYSLAMSVPHLAVAGTVLVWLAQSGLLARLAFAAGVISQPADFPVLVNDSVGVGLIVHYVAKETPFMVLVGVAALTTIPRQLNMVAVGLGATLVDRVRYVTWPAVRPAIVGAGLVSFAFVVHSVEAPLVLGATRPRMTSVVAAELFSEPTPERRASAAAIGVMLVLAVSAFGWLAFRWAGRWRLPGSRA